MQAIALSLQGSAVSDVVKDTVNVKKGENQTQQDSGRKRKKSVCYLKRDSSPFPFFFILSNCPVCSFICIQQSASRLQMTEDELVLHFFQFDGKLYYLCIMSVVLETS